MTRGMRDYYGINLELIAWIMVAILVCAIIVGAWAVREHKSFRLERGDWLCTNYNVTATPKGANQTCTQWTRF